MCPRTNYLLCPFDLINWTASRSGGHDCHQTVICTKNYPVYFFLVFLLLLADQISMNAAAAAMIAIKMQLALIPLDTMIASVSRVSLETGEIVQVKLYFFSFCQTTTEEVPPSPPNPLCPLKKAWLQERGTLFFPSGETHLVTLRWEGRSSLFFGKSGRGANASSQDPRLHYSLG